MTVDLKMEDGVVTDFAHDVKACALGQASSSIMAQHVVGASADELRAVRETMRKMLKENGAPPEGRFADLKYLEPVRDYKARHASTMLTFDAVVDAIGQIEKKRAEAGGLGDTRSNAPASESPRPVGETPRPVPQIVHCAPPPVTPKPTSISTALIRRRGDRRSAEIAQRTPARAWRPALK